MTFIDSPIARCEAMRTMVLTDETQAECAREHCCPPGQVCPLCGFFTETSGVAETDMPVCHPAKADKPRVRRAPVAA